MPYLMPLDHSEAWALLRSQSYGRLAVTSANQPDIYPVNFLANDSKILIRTAEGSKLEKVMNNERVAFEADDVTATRAWSVVVKGTASQVEDPLSLELAKRAPLWTWAPGIREIYLAISPSEVTGRYFDRT